MSQFCTGVLSPLYAAKMDVKIVNVYCVIMQVTKKCADFSLKIHQKRLAAGLHPDPLGELTALSRLDLRGRGKGKGKGTDRREQ